MDEPFVGQRESLVNLQSREFSLIRRINQQSPKVHPPDIVELNQNTFNQQIKTELSNFEEFYMAEEYHQNYFKKNPDAPYCIAVIEPKINKLKSR